MSEMQPGQSNPISPIGFTSPEDTKSAVDSTTSSIQDTYKSQIMDLLEFLTIYAPQYQNLIAQIRENLGSQQMFKDPVFAARLQQFIGLSIDSHYDVIK